MSDSILKNQEQLILDLINKKYITSAKDSRIYLSEELLSSYNINFDISFNILLDLVNRGFINNLKQEEIFILSDGYSRQVSNKSTEWEYSFNISKNFNKLYKQYNEVHNEKNDNKFPYKLPAGTDWSDFTIVFNDEENIFIKVKHFKHYANYKDFGLFGRGKKPSPGEPWRFFEKLAALHGDIERRDVESRDQYKKQKQLLSNALKEYFSLDYDPFYPYKNSQEKEDRLYRVKFTLFKEEKSRANAVIIPKKSIVLGNDEGEDEENDDKLGVKEYLDEITPNI